MQNKVILSHMRRNKMETNFACLCGIIFSAVIISIINLNYINFTKLESQKKHRKKVFKQNKKSSI